MFHQQDDLSVDLMGVPRNAVTALLILHGVIALYVFIPSSAFYASTCSVNGKETTRFFLNVYIVVAGNSWCSV